jgi:GH15 family glucan-1,4-alpha-glucosidase
MPAAAASFTLQPAIPFQATRRYLPRTNVLETTFTTDQGSVRVIDAMTLPNERLDPVRELVRSVDGIAGTVPMRWRCTPRFAYGSEMPRSEWRHGVPVAAWGAEAVGVMSSGTPERPRGATAEPRRSSRSSREDARFSR